MTDHSSHDFLMETVQQHNSNHFTTPSILHGTTTNLSLDGNPIRAFENASVYFLNSKPPVEHLLISPPTIHMNNNTIVNESTSNGVVVMNLEISNHADSAIHTSNSSITSNNISSICSPTTTTTTTTSTSSNNSNGSIEHTSTTATTTTATTTLNTSATTTPLTNVSGHNTHSSNAEDADVTMCICPVCGFSASSPRRQDEHMELVHGEVCTTMATTPASVQHSQNSSILQQVNENNPSNNHSTYDYYDYYQRQGQQKQQADEQTELQHKNNNNNDYTSSSSCNPFTLQAASTPQRVKLWSNNELLNPLFPLNEQLNIISKEEDVDHLNSVYNNKNYINSSLTLSDTTQISMLNSSNNINNDNTNLPIINTSNEYSPSSSSSSLDLKSSSKTLNNLHKFKQLEKVKLYSPINKSVRSTMRDKEKSLPLESSISLSTSTSSSSSLLSPPMSTMTSITATGVKSSTPTVVVGENFSQPVVKKVDSRRRYRCNICPTTFPWHGDLTEHLRSVHGMQKSRENSRNGKAGSFCCSHCKYVAKYQSELNRHMRLHWGVKPFICVFCPYRSAWKGDLKRHMESHHRERFTCETELIKIMSQFKNNAGTRSASASAIAMTTTIPGDECNSSNYSISQFDITTESSDGENLSEQYNFLQNDEEEQKINTSTNSNPTTTTSLTNMMSTAHKAIDIENLDNNPMENVIKVSSTMRSDEKASKSKNSSVYSNEQGNTTMIAHPYSTTNTTVVTMNDETVMNPTLQSNLYGSLSQSCIPFTKDNSNNNNLICDICSYQAQNQSKLKNHMASHINLKQFQCPICRQRSNYKWDITKHMKKQHPECNQLPITIINTSTVTATSTATATTTTTTTTETCDEEKFTPSSSSSSSMSPMAMTSTSPSVVRLSSVTLPASTCISSTTTTTTTSVLSSCSSRLQPFTWIDSSQIVSFLPIGGHQQLQLQHHQQQQQQQLKLFSQPQLTPTQSQILSTSASASSSSSSSISSISPNSNGNGLSLGECDQKKYSRLSEIAMAEKDEASPLNLIAYHSTMKQSVGQHNNESSCSTSSLIIAEKEALISDTVPIDLSIGYSQNNNNNSNNFKDEEIKNTALLFPRVQSSPKSPTSLKFLNEEYIHQYNHPIPNLSAETNSNIYSVSSTTIPSIGLSDLRCNFPSITHPLNDYNNSNNNNNNSSCNPSIISPYTIGSLISDPSLMKGNASSAAPSAAAATTTTTPTPTATTTAMNLLFNLQQQVLMTGLLQTWQQQQHQQQSQQTHDLHQNDVFSVNKNASDKLSASFLPPSSAAYSDIILSMTTPPVSTILSSMSPASLMNTTSVNGSNSSSCCGAISTLTTTPPSTNMSFQSIFKSFVHHQSSIGLPTITTTTSQKDTCFPSEMNTASSDELLKYTVKSNNNNNSLNCWQDTRPTIEWSLPPMEVDSIKSSSSPSPLSSTLPAVSQDHQRHSQHHHHHHHVQQQQQLQVNRFFTPGRRRESHRLLTRNSGRKSAPMSTSYNRLSSQSFCTDTTTNNNSSSMNGNNNSNNNNNNSKDEQWKRFQCSGCGHRSNWKWDINKHIKVAHPERTNITTITLELEDAKKTYNEYMNRLKLSRNRYLSESIPEMSTNSTTTWIGSNAGSSVSAGGVGLSSLSGNTTEGYYRPFKCSVCGHRSNWKWDVGKHIKQIHNGNGEVQTLSLEEARRTIHQYKSRRRQQQQHQHHQQHIRRSELGIKFEPSICSSSESNMNLSPASLFITGGGDGNTEHHHHQQQPVSSNDVIMKADDDEQEIRSLHDGPDDADDDDNLDDEDSNRNSLANKPSLSSQSSPLNLAIDTLEEDSSTQEDCCTSSGEIRKSSQLSKNHLNKKKISSSSSSLFRKRHRQLIKFTCKFCTVKLQSWRSFIFHSYTRHYHQQVSANNKQTIADLTKCLLPRIHFSVGKEDGRDPRHRLRFSSYDKRQPIKLFKRQEAVMSGMVKEEEEASKYETQKNAISKTIPNDDYTPEHLIQSTEENNPIFGNEPKNQHATTSQTSSKVKLTRVEEDQKHLSEFPSFVYRNSLKCHRIINKHYQNLRHESHSTDLKTKTPNSFPSEHEQKHQYHQSRPFRNLVCLNQPSDNGAKINSNLNSFQRSPSHQHQHTSQHMITTKNKTGTVVQLASLLDDVLGLLNKSQINESNNSNNTTTSNNNNLKYSKSDRNGDVEIRVNQEGESRMEHNDDVITHLTDMIHETVAKNENLHYANQLTMASMNSSTSSNEENQQVKEDRDESTYFSPINEILKHPEIEKRFLRLADLLHQVSRVNQ
uniref:C2H2-type domain-containing protein n=1 Tax=Trichobilharzia regenti TaxID=157069 RepID=A0AA85IVL9_TRIRE|nr:unnamed protein product [Trichobilharzia regenti]